MKKLLCLFLIFIAYFANCQDFEPTQAKFNWGIGGNEKYLSADSAYFKQDKFLRGWHWGASKKISHAVGVNQNDAHRTVTADKLDSNCHIILKPDEYTHGNEHRILNARAIQYEPTLTLNPNNPSELVIRQGDTTRPVFGFLNRRGRILTDSTDPNFNRLIIDSSSLVNQVILSEPWPSNQLSLALIGEKRIDSIMNTFLCKSLFFSINLRRTNSEMNNDTVLKIELPYTYLVDSTYVNQSNDTSHYKVSRNRNIQFWNLPSPAQYPDGTYELTNGRGCIRDTIPLNNSGVRAIFITKQMLPPNNKDITISALFKCNGDVSRNNHLLKDEYADTLEIDSIKIKVTYLGGGPLMIDWVRIETPHAKNFLSGDFDSLLTAKVQADLNKIIATPFSDKGIKLFRYNPVIEGRLHSWIAEKYYNKLIGNISTNEANKVIYPAHYEYYVNSPNRWFGTWACKSHISVPYSKKVYEINTENKAKTMGLFNGYNGMINDSIESDTTKVHYETYLINQGDGVDLDHFLNNPIDRAEYEQVMNTQNNYWRASFQAYIEDYLYTHFLKESTKGFLFSDKFWWNQGFVHLGWDKDTNYLPIYDPNKPTAAYFRSHRPLTGEEFRYFVGSGLILGAKGLFYDGGETNYDITKTQFYDGDCISPATRTILEELPDDEFLDSEIAGPDFIRTENEIMNLNDRLYYLDTIAKYLDRPKDKLYVGRRSLRKEMKRLHDQIRRCEYELMKLRLVAWMGKGYRLWNNHHPDYPANVLSQYIAWDTTRNGIDTTRFKIRPYERLQYVSDSSFQGYHYELYYEPWDSTFIDFTLLKDKDTSINDLGYIGIQNRRTDPLVPWFLKYDWYYIIDPNTEVVIDSVYIPFYDIKFYSTSEFEDSCDAIKNPNSYQTFRDNWFKRLGCRSVTLPFNYINTSNPDEYALLRITELGADEEFDSTWSYGRNIAYWNKIDTVIGQDKSITFNMLPGEGKIFKVQVLHPDTSVAGNLYHNGQSKLVSYPVIWQNGTEGDSIRYHLVYHRYIEPNRNGVFYRRSIPIKKDCNEENIKWESEILVSENVIIDSVFKVTRSCDYPSIVVRKDTNGVLKAYIVYSCDKKSNINMIAETILEVNNATVSSPNGKELSEYRGVNRFEWGNPVVNASSNGNYYAWSDSLSGIYAAWKTPNTATFQSGNKISFKYDYNPLVIAKHPSLNVYSNLDSLEDNCALVWQENQTNLFSAPNRILYTRLRRTYNLYKYLPTRFLGNPSLIQISNNVASIYNSFFIVQNPVISRKMGYYRKSGVEALCRRYDLIYWELANSYYSPALNFLANMLIYNYDTNNVAINWNAFGANYIRSYFSVINSPDIIHQTRLDDTYSTGGDVILNFKYARNLAYPYVGQFSYSSNSYSSSGSLDSSDINDLWVKSVGSGFLPHLSKSKNLIEKTNDTWKNRRVYNNNLGRIITSAKYFYKGQSDEMLADWYIGFETADSSKKSFLFGAPELDEQRFSLKLPFEKVVSEEGFISFLETSSDTIASSWFSIENPKELALKLKGSNNAKSKVYIQNKETERTLRLNLPNGLKENKGAKAKYNLINGLGNEFRLLFVKNDEAMHYTEELWIEGLPIEEKPAGSFKGNDGIENVDLIQIVNRYYSDHNISIFPNPASEVLYLQANVPFEEANLTVTNLLGTKVIQQQIDLSNSPELKLDISFLLPGIYYVYISTALNDQSDGLKSISGRFLKR